VHQFSVQSDQFITLDNILQLSSSFATPCPRWFTKSSETRCSSSWFVVAVSFQIFCFGSRIVCEQFLLALLQVSPWEKSGTVRSGDHTGHGIPYTWKHFLSLISTLHSQLILCHWRGFEMTSQHPFQKPQLFEIQYHEVQQLYSHGVPNI
jgi:hypothetical protein